MSVDQLINIEDMNKRAQNVLNYVYRCNNIETFEKFISIWRYLKREAASKFESKLEDMIRNCGYTSFKRPIKEFVPLNTPLGNTALDVTAPGSSSAESSVPDGTIVTNIYQQFFCEKRSIIESSLQIDPRRTPDIIKWLLEAKVIDDCGVNLIILLSESNDENAASRKAALVLDYLLGCNTVATYITIS